MNPADEPATPSSAAADPAGDPAQGATVLPTGRPKPPPGARTQQVLTWFVLILGAVSVVWLVVAIVRDEPGAAPTPDAPACLVQTTGCGLS